MTQRISATPDPVSPGGLLTICYDFSGGATGPVTLKLNFDSPTPSQQITVSVDAPCQSVTMPETTGLTIVDTSGQSEAHEVTVTP